MHRYKIPRIDITSKVSENVKHVMWLISELILGWGKAGLTSPHVSRARLPSPSLPEHTTVTNRAQGIPQIGGPSPSFVIRPSFIIVVIIIIVTLHHPKQDVFHCFPRTQ